MSTVDDDLVALKFTIAAQEERGDDYRAMTIASRHMRAAVLQLEDVSDERAQKAIRHLLDAVRELAEIEVPT